MNCSCAFNGINLPKTDCIVLLYCNFITPLEQSIEIPVPSHQNVLHCVPFSTHNICCYSLKCHCYIYMLMCDIPIQTNVFDAFEIAL